MLPSNIPQNISTGLPWWLSGGGSAYQCRGHGFNPWSRKIPTATEQLQTMCHNYWAASRTTEPTCCSHWGPSSAARGATTRRSLSTTIREQFWIIVIKPFITSSQGGTHSFLRQKPSVSPFAWRSDRAVLFYFPQNSVSKIWFGISVRRGQAFHNNIRLTAIVLGMHYYLHYTDEEIETSEI